MILNLYRIYDESNVLDKELNDEKIVNAHLIEDTDILKPQIKLSALENATPLQILSTYNYALIVELGRYYFITNVELLRGNMILLSLEVDVLKTYSESILNLNALVSRNESEYNPLIVDDRINFNYNKVTSVPTNITVGYSFDFDGLLSDNKYICVINVLRNEAISGNGTTGDFTELGKVNEYVSGAFASNTQYYVTRPSDCKKVINAVYSNDTLRGYVKSIMVLPYEPDVTTLAQNRVIKIGDTDIQTDNVVFLATHSNYNRQLYATIIIPTATKFTDFEPYTELKMWIPFAKETQISIAENNGSTLKLFYNVDFESGLSTYILYNETKGYTIESGSASLGVKIGISSTNQLEIDNQRINLTNSAILGSLTSAVSLGVGVATANPVAIMGGLMGMGKTMTETFTKASQMRVTASPSVNGGVSALLNITKLKFRQTKMIFNNADYQFYYGRPLYEVKQLEELSGTGYTEIAQIHVHSVPCLKTEADEIEQLLKSGVIL